MRFLFGQQVASSESRDKSLNEALQSAIDELQSFNQNIFHWPPFLTIITDHMMRFRSHVAGRRTHTGCESIFDRHAVHQHLSLWHL